VLIASIRHGTAEVTPIERVELFDGFDAEALRVIASAVTTASYPAGTPIVRQGEPADALYAIASGSAVIGIAADERGALHRIGAMGPGVGFGELALFDAGTRTATVEAETNAICYRLGMDAIRTLQAEAPGVYAQLLVNVGRSLSRRLRRANDEIRALST
jgi:glutaminase